MRLIRRDSCSVSPITCSRSSGGRPPLRSTSRLPRMTASGRRSSCDESARNARCASSVVSTFAISSLSVRTRSPTSPRWSSPAMRREKSPVASISPAVSVAVRIGCSAKPANDVREPVGDDERDDAAADEQDADEVERGIGLVQGARDEQPVAGRQRLVEDADALVVRRCRAFRASGRSRRGFSSPPAAPPARLLDFSSGVPSSSSTST